MRVLWLALAALAFTTARAWSATDGLPRHSRRIRSHRRPVIVIGIDGLSARAVAGCSEFDSIVNNSAYTLQARAPEYTQSYENWHAIMSGSWDKGVPIGPSHPPLFTYLRTQMRDPVLWHIGRYYVVRNCLNVSDADVWDYQKRPEGAVGSFEQRLNAGARVPDLTILYFLYVDNAGHRYGWDSDMYKATVTDMAVLVKRVAAAAPTAIIYIVSDHGGRGHGHRYRYRDMHDPESDIDSPWHRDVPWIRYNDPNPRPLCDAIRSDETLADIAHVMGVRPHPSWRARAGWLQGVPCTHADVAPRVGSFAVDKRTQFEWAVTAAFLFIVALF